MSDTRPVFDGVKVLHQIMDEVARESREMDLDDPRRVELIKRLHRLGQLNFSMTFDRDGLVKQRMNQLAQKAESLKTDDPRRARIVNEILELSELVNRSKE